MKRTRLKINPFKQSRYPALVCVVLLILFAAIFFGFPRGRAQKGTRPISPSISIGTPDTLAASGSTIAWTDDSTLPGWYSGQKFIFFLMEEKGCFEIDPDPYRKFIERAINDFSGTVVEFKQIAESLKQAGKIKPAPAVLLPLGGHGPKAPTPEKPSLLWLKFTANE